MKPPFLSYISPKTLDEVVSLLDQDSQNSRILAGGQSLMTMLNMRLIRPRILIDIKNINMINNITVTDEGLLIGANVTQQELLEYKDLSSTSPLLYKVLPWVGHYQTRTKGTICGSIAHADPSSELPLCFAMLNGKIKLRSMKQTRVIEAREFQTGMLSTACKPNEIIESVLFPILDNKVGVAFNEFSFRKGDFSLLSVAAIYKKDSIIIGITGMTDKPYIAAFPILSNKEIEDALNDVAWKLKGIDDHISSARYKRDLLRKIGKLTVKEAYKCQKR